MRAEAAAVAAILAVTAGHAVRGTARHGASKFVPSLALFRPRHARAHRLLGAAYFVWLALGYWLAFRGLRDAPRYAVRPWWLAYDAVLGLLGVGSAWTASTGFPSHRRSGERNREKGFASGALDEAATVSTAEMQEHAYFQAMNLVQILLLHALAPRPRAPGPRALYLLSVYAAANAWWLVRGRFPVHSFSANYAGSGKALTLTNLMYRVKKWQYVTYKHLLLAGVNATCLVRASRTTPPATGRFDAPLDPAFRLYWQSLNAAYSLEFFQQTLVKRKRLDQRVSLALNAALMAVCTVATLRVLRFTSLAVAAVSLSLNFLNRGHDFANAFAVLLYACLLDFHGLM